ncbi:hypothetical protein [Peribacillus simplex]|uniref:hypothetical protein n=1 Tax=Peribacillus simplex TaxID=1478 RepID=UPI0011A8921F|nr:hypothetical protein [Peribacillus simplex]
MNIHWTQQKVQAFLTVTGLSIKQLSSALGVSARLVDYIVKGEVPVSKAMQKKLNEFYAEVTNVEKHLKSVEKLKQSIEGVEQDG